MLLLLLIVTKLIHHNLPQSGNPINTIQTPPHSMYNNVCELPMPRHPYFNGKMMTSVSASSLQSWTMGVIDLYQYFLREELVTGPT